MSLINCLLYPALRLIPQLSLETRCVVHNKTHARTHLARHLPCARLHAHSLVSGLSLAYLLYETLDDVR